MESYRKQRAELAQIGILERKCAAQSKLINTHNEAEQPCTFEDFSADPMCQKCSALMALNPDCEWPEDHRLWLCTSCMTDLAESLLPTLLERDQLHHAIRAYRDAKGRYHTQLACERLVSLLPENAERRQPEGERNL